MKQFFYILFFTCVFFNGIAQGKIETVHSDQLNSPRELKIQLPRNYDSKAERVYPLIIVLDGDYLFEPVAGNVDYQAYWEDIPECFVVGVNQEIYRSTDFEYDDAGNLTENGEKFYMFLAKELIPYLESKYRVSAFKVVVGHDDGANFINNFLLKNKDLFRAYISLSPDLEEGVVDKIKPQLASLKEETFYYLATGSEDFKAIKSEVVECDAKLKTVENEKLKYTFHNFDDANHYSLVGMGIPKALTKIFTLYKPIDGKEYREKILTYEGSPYDYLIKKYDDIKYFYGFKKQLTENDIRAIAAASKKKDDLTSLENLALLVKEEYPKSMLSAYYMGMYYEKEGSLSKALLQYKSGLMLEPSQYIDKEMMLDKMYQIQDELKN